MSKSPPKRKTSPKKYEESSDSSSDDENMPEILREANKKIKAETKEENGALLLTNRARELVTYIRDQKVFYCTTCKMFLSQEIITCGGNTHPVCFNCYFSTMTRSGTSSCPTCRERYPFSFELSSSDSSVKTEYQNYLQGDTKTMGSDKKNFFSKITSLNNILRGIRDHMYQKECPTCKDRVNCGDYDLHVTSQCPEVIVKCHNEGCSFSDIRRIYEETHKDTCEWRIVQCDKCQNMMPFNKHSTHYAACNDKKCNKCRKFFDLKDFPTHGDPCDLCKMHVLCGELPTHKASECGDVDVTCKNCRKQVLRKNENTHDATCTHCNKTMSCSGRLAHQDKCPEKYEKCTFCLKNNKLKDADTHTTECDLCNTTYVCCKHEEHKANQCLNRYVQCTRCQQSIMFKGLNPGLEEHKIECKKCRRFIPCSMYESHTDADCNNMTRCRKCLQDVTRTDIVSTPNTTGGVTVTQLSAHTVACTMCKKTFGCTEYYTTHFKTCPDGFMNCSACHKVMKRKEHASTSCGGSEVKKPVETKKEEPVKKPTTSSSSSSSRTTTATTTPDPAILAKITNKQFDSSTHSYLESNYVKLVEPPSNNKVRERMQIAQDKIAEFLQYRDSTTDLIFTTNYLWNAIKFFEFVVTNSGGNNYYAWEKYNSAITCVRSSNRTETKKQTLTDLIFDSNSDHTDDHVLPAYQLNAATGLYIDPDVSRD